MDVLTKRNPALKLPASTGIRRSNYTIVTGPRTQYRVAKLTKYPVTCECLYLKTLKIVSGLACCVLAFQIPAQETSSTNRLYSQLIDGINSSARADFEAACITVTRQVKQKRLLIFATVPIKKTATIKDGDFEIEIYYSADLAKENLTAGGAYFQHHNSKILTFAAAQFAAGKKDFGLHLATLLAEAQPDAWWSSPKHDPITIQKIVDGLEAGGESVRQFLKEETEDWDYRIKTYSP